MASTSEPAPAGRQQTLQAPDGQVLALRVWDRPDPVGVVQVVHGLAEHCGRYGRLALALNEAGWAAIAHDVRGHGATASAGGEPGHMCDAGGWPALAGDVGTVRAHAGRLWPGRQVVLLGHSMGSVLALSALQRPEAQVADGRYLAAAFSGPPGLPPPVARLGLAVAGLERWRLGQRGSSRLLNALSFGAYARAIPDARTPFDWLSRDAAEVDAYIADPWCGFVPSVGSWTALVRGLVAATRADALAALPPGLELLVLAGGSDPVGGRGRSVRALVDSLEAAGRAEAVLKLYPGARHEVFNESNRAEVTADLLAWLAARQGAS